MDENKWYGVGGEWEWERGRYSACEASDVAIWGEKHSGRVKRTTAPATITNITQYSQKNGQLYEC